MQVKINDINLEIFPRRPYWANFYRGIPHYMESDKDYVLNNLDTCIWLLDYLLELANPEITGAKEKP